MASLLHASSHMLSRCCCSGSASTRTAFSPAQAFSARRSKGPLVAAPRSIVTCRAADTGRAMETREDQFERRLRESAQVEERVQGIRNEDQFLQALEDAGDKLVVVEVQSEQVCETGLDEPEPEIHWKLDAERAHALRMAKCTAVKHVIQRTARECPDVVFLAIESDDDPSVQALIEQLGVKVLPTLQFYRDNKLLWEHRGVMQMESGVGDAVMYYGDSAAGGVQPSSYVTEITSRAKLQEWLGSSTDPNVLQVLNISLTSAGPCIKVFPAMVALSRSFQGFASFARLLGDTNGDTRGLLAELNVVEVPTFVFFRGGKEVARHVGSSRGDLIGQILTQQEAVGLSPPPPPAVTAKRRSRAGLRRK